MQELDAFEFVATDMQGDEIRDSNPFWFMVVSVVAGFDLWQLMQFPSHKLDSFHKGHNIQAGFLGRFDLISPSSEAVKKVYVLSSNNSVDFLLQCVRCCAMCTETSSAQSQR